MRDPRALGPSKGANELVILPRGEAERAVCAGDVCPYFQKCGT